MRICLLITLLFSFSSFAFDEFKFANVVGLKHSLIGQPWTFNGVSSIFVSSDFSRQMMVVNNVPGKLTDVSFVEAEGYLIINVPSSAETFTSIALIGISREAIRPYLVSSFNWKSLFHILPTAYASDCRIDVKGNSSIDDLANFFTKGPGSGFASCLLNFVQGAWSTTGGAVQNFAEGLVGLVSNPKKFWDKKVEQLKRMKTFFNNFQSEMTKLYDQVSNLDANAKTQIMCGFLGGIGGAALTSFIMMGTGLGQLITQVSAYVVRITGLARVFSLLASLGKMAKISEGFFAGIVNGKVSDEVIERLDSFARNRMDSVVEGAIQCAL